MVIQLCSRLSLLVSKLYYLGKGLLHEPKTNDGWRREVKELLWDMWRDLDEIEKSCPEKQGILEYLRNMLSYYWNYGPRDYETPEYIGGYLVSIANTIRVMEPPQTKSIRCSGKKFSYLEELYKIKVSDVTMSVILARTMIEYEDSLVILTLSSNTNKILATVWRYEKEKFAVEGELDEVVKTGKLGKIEVDPIQIARIHSYVKGEIEFHQICNY